MNHKSMSWLPIGPAPQVNSDGRRVSGRVITMGVSSNYDGSSNSALFIGTDGGGVWRSLNFGTDTPHWVPLTDNLFLPVLSKVNLLNITSIAVDENNPSVIYVTFVGGGVLKSWDGGMNWELLGRATFGGQWPISKILVDLTDRSGNTLYLTGGAAGVYKSRDGGASWSPSVNGLPNNFRASDLGFRVDGSGQVALFVGISYALVDDNRGIWASQDNGDSWSQLPMNLVSLETGATVGREKIDHITIAVDPRRDSSSAMYAAVNTRTSNHLLNVFRFASATSMGVPVGSDLPKVLTTQGINQPIGVTSDGTIYLGTSATGAFQSADQGASWTLIERGRGGPTHVDDWCWAFFGDAVYAGNDGGVWRYTPAVKTWASLNTDGLQTHLVNGVGMHPTDTGIIVVGSQDNETALLSGGQWKQMIAGPGDGGRALIDPDPKKKDGPAYSSGPPDPNPNFFFRADSLSKATWTEKGFLSDNNPPFVPIFAIASSQTSRILLPLGQVFETRDQGDNWKAISPPLVDKTANASAIACSATGDVIYVSYGAAVFKTINSGGDRWPKVVNDWQGSVSAVVVDQENSDRAFLATDTGKIWRTLDGGSTWEDITGDFPTLRVTCLAIKLEGNNDGRSRSVFAGTTVGVYSSFAQDSRTTWKRLGSGLPDTLVTDLQFNSNTNTLAAALWGRGVFLWSPAHEWQTVNVSRKTGEKIVTPVTSWQTPNGPYNVEHLAGISPNGDVLVFIWSPAHDWQVVNVSIKTGQRVSGPLTSWQTPNGPLNVEHLAGMSPSGDLLVFVWSPAHDWQAINVSAKTGEKIAGPLTSWQTPNGPLNVEHLAGMSPSGDLLVFVWSPAHDWQAINISARTRAPIASSVTSWQFHDGTLEIENLAGRNLAGDLLVFRWSPETDWQLFDVSDMTGEPIESSLTSWQTPDGPYNVEHLAGYNQNRDLIVFFRTTW